MRSAVVLPQPDGPTSTQISPAGTSNDRFRKVGSSAPGYRLETSRNSSDAAARACCRGLLDWTLGAQCRDGDVLPYGYGVMEMLGLDLQCVDTASLTVEALVGLAGMADVLGEAGVAGHPYPRRPSPVAHGCSR